MFRCNYLGAIFLGGNCPEGNCLAGICPRRELCGRGAIILGGNCPGGNCLGESSGRQLFRGNCHVPEKGIDPLFSFMISYLQLHRKQE